MKAKKKISTTRKKGNKGYDLVTLTAEEIITYYGGTIWQEDGNAAFEDSEECGKSSLLFYLLFEKALKKLGYKIIDGGILQHGKGKHKMEFDYHVTNMPYDVYEDISRKIRNNQ